MPLDSTTLAKVLADTMAYGFEFVWSNVSTDEGKTDLGIAPILKINNVEKFEKFAPGRIVAMLNSSNSPRVASQGVTRPFLIKNRLPNNERDRAVLKEKVLARILEMREVQTITREVPVYVLPDGTSTKDQAAALAAWKNSHK